MEVVEVEDGTSYWLLFEAVHNVMLCVIPMFESCSEEKSSELPMIFTIHWPSSQHHFSEVMSPFRSRKNFVFMMLYVQGFFLRDIVDGSLSEVFGSLQSFSFVFDADRNVEDDVAILDPSSNVSWKMQT